MVSADAFLDRDQVRRRIETGGVLEIVPLTRREPDSGFQQSISHREPVYSDEWAPVHPDCGHVAPIGQDFVTRVLEPSAWEFAKWPYYVSIYSRKVVLCNQDFKSIASEGATSPSISRIRMAVNVAGKSKLQEYPAGFIDWTGHSTVELYSGLLVDGWLWATISPIELSQWNGIRFVLPYSPRECEDVVVAANHPMYGYACKLISERASR